MSVNNSVERALCTIVVRRNAAFNYNLGIVAASCSEVIRCDSLREALKSSAWRQMVSLQWSVYKIVPGLLRARLFQQIMCPTVM